MTEAAEAAGRPSRRLPIEGHAAPALVVLAVVVAFLRFHQYDLLQPESLILIIGAVAIGALLGLAARLRPATVEPAVIAGLLVCYLLYRPEFVDALRVAAGWLASLGAGGGLSLTAAGLVLYAAVALLCWSLRQNLCTIVSAVFGTIVASTIFLPTTTGGEPVVTGALPTPRADLPPIIHIILDEHIGLAGLPDEPAESRSTGQRLRATYKDFAHYIRAYSRFAETKYSLAALFNAEFGSKTGSLLYDKPGGYGLRNNAWFDLLKRRGYAISVYQSDWLDLCSGSAAVDVCYTYPLYSPNAVQRTDLSTGARLRVLLGKLSIGQEVPQLSPIASTEALLRFQADLQQAPRGVAYVLHLLLPHFGYMYRGNCSLTDPADWQSLETDDGGVTAPEARVADYGLYLQQLDCTTNRINALFDRLRALAIYDEATIIVHGDHGSRIGEQAFRFLPADALSERDLIDHFSTLLAIKAPGLPAGVRSEPALLQEVFAQTFLEGTGHEPPSSAQVLVRSGADMFSGRDLVWPGELTDAPSGQPIESAAR